MIHLEMERQTHLEFGRQGRGGERRAADLRRQAVELAEDLRSESQNNNSLFLGYIFPGVGIILDNLAKDNKDNAKFYLYLYLR